MPTINSRAEAIRVATEILARDHRRRAGVFAVIAAHLHDGPAPVSYRTIATDYLHPSPRGPFVEGLWRGGLDRYTGLLIGEGWLTIVREADQQDARPRVWDLGPAVAQAYAPVLGRKRFAQSLAAVR